MVNNPGSTADALRSASAEIAKSTEVHQTKMEGDVMKMSPVEMIPIPAQGKVELKPGSYHIMLIELKQELKVGDTFKVKVNFEKAGPTIIEVKVRQP